jgi:hypothetical protein
LVLSLAEQLGAEISHTTHDNAGCRFALRFRPELPELKRLAGGDAGTRRNPLPSTATP